MRPHETVHELLKAQHFSPEKAVEMLRPIISMLRNMEPHSIEAHEASLALGTLIEGLKSESDIAGTLWSTAFIKLGAFESTLV